MQCRHFCSFPSVTHSLAPRFNAGLVNAGRVCLPVSFAPVSPGPSLRRGSHPCTSHANVCACESGFVRSFRLTWFAGSVKTVKQITAREEQLSLPLGVLAAVVVVMLPVRKATIRNTNKSTREHVRPSTFWCVLGLLFCFS